ncbi:MAG: UvrD-helicase domain-containing protein [Clostridia bacterium]|nr:UvrD-helicase domain-containing protein [Clostridia bacterium]
MGWTEKQSEAISTRKKNILVSAAAGSGKTAVLSARVVDFVQKGGKLDRLLIATFTVAAAGEMRSRIAKDIAACAAQNPGDAHLRRQSLTLYKAKISTIDSYGIDLIRRNFLSAGVSPDFTVLDDTELNVIRASVLQQQVEEYYHTLPEGFAEFETLFSEDSEQSSMVKIIPYIAEYLSSVPFCDRWLEEQANRLCDVSSWCNAACDAVTPILKEYLAIFDEVAQNQPFSSEKQRNNFEDDHLLLRECCTALDRGDWDEVCRRVRGHVFAKAATVKSDTPREGWLYKEYRNRMKAFLQSPLFENPTAQCEADLRRLEPALRFLFRAVSEYRTRLMEEMHKRSAYSFSALSEMALTLTVDDYSHETGDFTPSAVALAERELYDEVLIDEYQDVNDIQDLFFRAITQDNCFAVGDVKQSIYGFRGSNSENFLNKKATFHKIPLNKNFRSRAGILDFANFVFRGLFTPDLGGICYDDEEMLSPGRDPDDALAYPSDDRKAEEGTRPPDVELLVLPTGGRLLVEHHRQDAHLCAKMIRDAVEGGATVFDKHTKQPRPMTYSDIAILLRNGTSMPLYEEVFRNWNIPLLTPGGESFLDSIPVCGVLAFLQAVDDPWNDLALFVTLTGNVFSLSEEEVAVARLKAKDRSLWEGLNEYAKENPKAKHAVHTLEKFRILAENLPIPKLLWEVYTATDYLALESTADPAARSHLMRFYTFARRYTQNNGLFDFLDFVRRAQVSGKVKEKGAGPDGQFVRIMTVHSSKGLEFAWCIVPELEHAGRGNTPPVEIDRTLGIGTTVKNENGTAEYPTLMQELIKLRNIKQNVAEELRILYVALTRPRDRMTLISRCTDKLEQWAAWGFHSQDGIVRPLDRLDMSSLRDLLFDRAVAHPDAKILQSPWLSPEAEQGKIRVIYGEIPEEIPPAKAAQKTYCNLTEEELNRRFSFRYDGHLSTVPAKVSVTEIAKAPADPDSALLISSPPVSKPKFLDETALTGAEAGTAIHTYCQFADFDKPVETEIQRLTKAGHLTETTANALNRRDLQRFLDSDLQKLFRSSLRYDREVRFTCRIPVSYYTGNPGEEGEMLLQGAMDLLCETEQGYWIIDLKSDRATEEELLTRYSRQLNLYAAAVRRLYDKPVLGCKIWSFPLGKAIDVKEEEL